MMPGKKKSSFRIDHFSTNEYKGWLRCHFEMQAQKFNVVGCILKNVIYLNIFCDMGILYVLKGMKYIALAKEF